jgi:hypothetical protein
MVGKWRELETFRKPGASLLPAGWNPKRLLIPSINVELARPGQLPYTPRRIPPRKKISPQRKPNAWRGRIGGCGAAANQPTAPRGSIFSSA